MKNQLVTKLTFSDKLNRSLSHAKEGATEGSRTLDLAFTKRLLCQLSYGGLAGGGDYTSSILY